MKFNLLPLLFGMLTFLVLALPVQAQFSGSDPDNYRCPIYARLDQYKASPGPRLLHDSQRIVCAYVEGGCDQSIPGNCALIYRNASPKPPTLQIVEVWLVRIIYMLWALAGIAFTASLIWIGFKYMTSFNNQYDVGKIIGEFRKWIIGLAIIFLSYPILVTFFRILPLSNSQCYTDINMPGFQFFFPTVCQTRDSYCQSRYYGASNLYSQCMNGTID